MREHSILKEVLCFSTSQMEFVFFPWLGMHSVQIKMFYSTQEREIRNMPFVGTDLPGNNWHRLKSVWDVVERS